MAKWKLIFLLFVSLCFTSEEFFIKTIRNKEDVVQICTSATSSGFTMIICKIRTQRSGGEECRLLYLRGQVMKHECGPMFMLMANNQTAFLNLTGLTPVDSGNCTCECVHPDGMDTVTLNITVEVTSDSVPGTKSATHSVEIPLSGVSLGAVLFIIMMGVGLALIYKRLHRSRGKSRLQSSPPDTEVEDIEPYSTFTQKENGLYSTTRLPVCHN